MKFCVMFESSGVNVDIQPDGSVIGGAPVEFDLSWSWPWPPRSGDRIRMKNVTVVVTHIVWDVDARIFTVNGNGYFSHGHRPS